MIFQLSLGFVMENFSDKVFLISAALGLQHKNAYNKTCKLSRSITIKIISA